MIDFDIIWKDIHNLDSNEEKEKLEAWLKESPLHEEYYKRQKEIYLSGKSIHHYGPDVEKSWKNLNSKVISKRRSRLAWFSSVAAAIILAVLVIFYQDIFINQNPIYSENADENQIDIGPGSNKAILVLDDGTEFKLSDTSSLNIKEGNAAINTNGSAIKYSSNLLKPESKSIKYNILKVPRGGEFFVVLSDSSKIWLNSETTLRYPVEFVSNERIVTLEGEGYFEVAHSDKPFKVITGEQVVEVLGTSFNISSYKEDALTFTTLIEGKVKVFLEDKPEIQQTLQPNYQSYLYKNEQIISIREVDPFPYIAWKEGRFFFKKKPLSEIANTLSRWYDVDIKIENTQIGNLKFTGDLKRYENLNNILTLIKETNEISYEFTDESTVTIK